MLTAIVWKEWRQQAAILVAILVLAGVALGSVALFMPNEWANRRDDWGLTGTLLCVIVALAVTQGVVTGALLFAGESEERTQEFLDVHAGLRFPVWKAKVVAGLSIVCLSAAALGGLIAVTRLSHIGWVVLALWFALDALVWTMAASALRSTTFGAIGVGLFFLVLVAGLPLNLLNTPAWPIYFLAKGPLMAAALVLSWRAYCASDRWRAFRPEMDELGSRQPGPVRVALWRAWAGQKVTMLILALVAVGMVVDSRLPWAIIWPAGTFLLGCVAGWAVFADETREASERFLGDQRLPLGRVWLGKAAPLFAIGLIACLAVLVLGLIREAARQDENDFLVILRHGSPMALGPLGALLFFTYGFAFAMALSQHATKMPVAVFLTVALGGATAALSYPSLYHGMPAWRLAVVPAVLLVASARSMRRWTSGRLHDRGGLVLLAVTALGLAAWLAGNLWWRVLEVPDIGEPFDTRAAWSNLIKTPDDNGAALRQAGARATELLDATVAARFAKMAEERDKLRMLPLPGVPGAEPPRKGAEDEAAAALPDDDFLDDRGWAGFESQVLESGFPKDAGEYQKILDEVFAGDWALAFQKAALAPPDRYQTTPELQTWHHGPARHTGEHLYAIRALSRARKGDVDGTIADFDVALSATRHALNRTNGSIALSAIDLNIVLLQAVELTFRQPIFDKPGYREKLAALLAKHDDQLPGFAGIVESMWFLADARPPGVEIDRVKTLIDAPWERARADRQLRRVVAAMLDEAKTGRFPPPTGREAREYRRPELDAFQIRLDIARDGYAGGVELVRAMRLAVAASEAAASRGRPVRSLAELTPAPLPHLPQSAYIGGEFRLIEAVSIERTRVVGSHRVNQTMVLGQGVIVDDAAPMFFVVVPK